MIYQAYRLKIQKNLQGQKERSFALSIIKTTKDNLAKTQCLKQMKENQRDLQERMLCLNPKKLCIRRNQSNQPEKTLLSKQKKENQSNQKGGTLFLGQKKLFIRGNQSNQKGETLFLGQKKENQNNQKGETLFLGQKKENQNNQKGGTLFKGKRNCLSEGIKAIRKEKPVFRTK